MSSRDYSLEITPEADDDLVSILNYTQQTWGEEQANRYEAHLMRALDFVRRHPYAARLRSELSPSVRSHLVQGRRHIVYFRIDDNVVSVLRILHVRMNPESFEGSEE